ncbi:MAG TPA: DUF5317 domain-containing protein [Thermoleophilaceae bacterium]
MLLVIAAALLIATVPLAGGDLKRLGELDIRASWTVLLSCVIQVGITSAIRGGSHEVHVVLHFVSYALVAWFLFANRHMFGIPLLAFGALLNVLAIATNDGTMPASSFALRVSGIDTSGGFDNSGHVEHAHVAFLGDVIPVPGPWPIGNVLSIGDLLIYAGGFIVLHYACQSRLAWGRRRLANA